MLSDHPIQISSMQSAGSSSLFMPQGSLNSIPMHFQDPTAFGALGPALGPAQQIDLNSPDMFKNNIHLAQDHILRVRELAQSAIEAIERAYHPHSNPVQVSAEVIALKQALDAFKEFLRESGVGSLPLVASDATEARNERELIEDMTKSVQALFGKRQRRQENAAGVASLLAVPESRARRQS